jgi:hypothetical protein
MTGRSSLATRQRSRKLGAAVAVTTLLSAGAATAHAWGTPLPCVARPETRAFAAWNDPADYFLVPDGGFEGPATHWRLGGSASIEPGNEPTGVVPGGKSLRVGPGGVAENRSICVQPGEEKWRFLVRPETPDAEIQVWAEISAYSTTIPMWIETFRADSKALTPVGDGWYLTPPLWIRKNSMTLLLKNFFRGKEVRWTDLSIEFRGMKGTWRIDSVHLDPFRSR